MGAAQTLQETSAEAARDLLGGPPAAAATQATAASRVGGASSLQTAGAEVDASTAGWRAPFRWDGDVCRIVDQRRLPDVLVELELRGSADTVGAINDGALAGSAAQAQVAAVTLAMVAAKAAGSRPMPGGRRSVVPPGPCASRAPVPRRWPRPWTGCWRCSKRRVSRRPGTTSRPRSTLKRSGSSARPRRITGPWWVTRSRRFRVARRIRCASWWPAARARWVAASSGRRSRPSRRSTTRDARSTRSCRRVARVSRAPA